MSQSISNDYVSMINKRGSGYNIPEIVDAIVEAEIVPVKEIVTAQKEQVDASLSGMSILKSSMSGDADACKFHEFRFSIYLKTLTEFQLHAFHYCGPSIP